MFGKARRNHRTGDIPVHDTGGAEIGVVFEHDGWYAMSYATQAQVGGVFGSQEGAETALRDSCGGGA